MLRKHCIHSRHAQTHCVLFSIGFVFGWQLHSAVSSSFVILNVLSRVCVFGLPLSLLHQPFRQRRLDRNWQDRSPCWFRVPFVRCSSAWKWRYSRTSVALSYPFHSSQFQRHASIHRSIPFLMLIQIFLGAILVLNEIQSARLLFEKQFFVWSNLAQDTSNRSSGYYDILDLADSN